LEKERAGKFDAVVSNPPYITDAEMKTLAPEVREYEPRVALAAGEQGLDVIGRLIPQAEELLTPDGYLLMEISEATEPGCKELLSKTTLVWEETVPDLQGKPRVFIAKKRRA
jgi:release factor glutamine methyltransferase